MGVGGATAFTCLRHECQDMYGVMECECAHPRPWFTLSSERAGDSHPCASDQYTDSEGGLVIYPTGKSGQFCLTPVCRVEALSTLLLCPI